jgi:hypothetical protein
MKGNGRLKNCIWELNNNKKSLSSRPVEVVEYSYHPHKWRTILQDYLDDKRDVKFFMPGDTPEYYKKSLLSEELIVDTGDIEIWQPRKTFNKDGPGRPRDDVHWAWCTRTSLVVADIFDPKEQMGTVDDESETVYSSSGNNRNASGDWNYNDVKMW